MVKKNNFSDERMKTGIKGFDEIVGGGIPKQSNVLVVGTPGTGKSIFGLEFIWHGLTFGEAGVYVSFEQSEYELKTQALQFGWDFDKFKDKFVIVYVPPAGLGLDILKDIKNAVDKVGAKRVVIDSLAIMSINAVSYEIPVKGIPKKFEEAIPGGLCLRANEGLQHFVYVFMNYLKDLKTTNLIITDSPESGEYISRDEVSEFACDGVIKMKATEGEEFRNLTVLKMRKTKQKRGIFGFDITDKGIVVRESED